MTSSVDFDIGLGLEGSHVVVTGGGGQIGQVIVQAFLAAGSFVTAFDINKQRMTMEHDRLLWLEVDVTDEQKVEGAFDQARRKFGIVSTCIAAAGLDLSFLPHHESICDLPVDQWRRTMDVNATGAFITAKSWLRGIKEKASNTDRRNLSLIIMGSEVGVFGMPGNADYASSKAAIQYGLVKSLAPEAARYGYIRVNALAPGPVHTPQFDIECAENPSALYHDAGATVALGKPVPMAAIARGCLMLASDTYSSHITAQVVSVDSGKIGRLFRTVDDKRTW